MQVAMYEYKLSLTFFGFFFFLLVDRVTVKVRVFPTEKKKYKLKNNPARGETLTLWLKDN